MQKPLIADHGVIGNLKSAALICTRGGVDFFCFPNFDSPTVFAALLDREKGGIFELQPVQEDFQTKQRYLAETNILVTTFLLDEGIAELTDLMPVSHVPGEHANQLVRHLRVTRGEVKFRVRCAPRFDYARASHHTANENEGVAFRPQNSEIAPMILHGTVPLEIQADDAVAEFTLRRNQTATFTLSSVAEFEKGVAPILDEPAFCQLLRGTAKYWTDWLAESTYQGRWREMVNRSALVLKLLSHQEHGSLLAAVTFGLPERIGGARNWDYRYTWLRDSALTIYAFLRLGFAQEPRLHAQFFRNRIDAGLKTNSPNGPLSPMYRLDGGSEMPEIVLDHFSGYMGSRPVRVGNAAQDQLQLDIYGELMDAIYLANKYGAGIPQENWKKVSALLSWLSTNWQRPDQGIWEVRNGNHHHLHSRLMCWVAFDRAIRLASKRSLVAPLADWHKTRDAIHEDIFNNFWSEKRRAYVQTRGSDDLDAAVLMMPMMRFISPADPRWLTTMAAIEDHLSEGGLVQRYADGTDGLDGKDGSFTPCSFWLVECLARAGQIEKAQLQFDTLLTYANHLGLYSEEIGRNGQQLGNFPQALTHLALISAATYLDRKLSGVKNELWQ